MLDFIIFNLKPEIKNEIPEMNSSTRQRENNFLFFFFVFIRWDSCGGWWKISLEIRLDCTLTLGSFSIRLQ